MPRLLAVLVAALVAVLCVAGPGLAVSTGDIEQDVDYVAEVVDGWADSPVYVDPSQTELLSDEQARVLADRIRAGQPDAFVAVLPAAALDDQRGDDRGRQARTFLSAVARAQGSDGIYIVSFGGIGSYAESVGVPVDAGAAIRAESAEHADSAVPQLLDAVLTRLGYPGGGTGEQTSTVWIWVLGGVMAGLALAVLGAIRRFLRRRKEKERAAAVEEPADQAPYPPSPDVLPDQVDTVQERIELARADLTRLGTRLDAVEPARDPRVAAHLQAAVDAYADAGRHVEAATTDRALRRVREIADYSRWRLACAEALRAGQPAPPRSAACFVDPRHGMAVADEPYAPVGGISREVPLCADCAARIRAGERP